MSAVQTDFLDGYLAGVDAANLAWKNRIVPLLKELQESEYLSEQQCAELCGTDILWWRFFRDEQGCGMDAKEDQRGYAPAPLPESMSRDDMLRYYSEYANMVCGEVAGYQKRIREIQADMQGTLEALRIVKQALPEIRQAALNPNWFTHGEAGARRHFVHWHGKARDAVDSSSLRKRCGNGCGTERKKALKIKV